ncbi:hypothetical protein AALB16_15680 [Lachnospiraceae bacterium 62-35]
MKKIMAVYDGDEGYAERLADFINSTEKIPLRVVAFTSLERLKRYGEDHDIEILLVGSAMDRKEIEQISSAHTIILSEGGTEGETYPAIYKYQSSHNVIREVMACYGEREVINENSFLAIGKIVGVYSPVNRCLKTSFALTLGQILSQEEKTIYINLEDCSGLSVLMNEMFRGDLSDILYFYRQGKYNWARLSSIVYTWGSLDYVPPARYPEDLCQMEAADMGEFLSDMAKSSSYRTIVVDVGQFGRKAADLLEVCDRVYMPIKEDSVSTAKLEEFETYLEVSGHRQLKERIQKIRLPTSSRIVQGKSYIEGLMWSDMGDYVRKLLKGGIM